MIKRSNRSPSPSRKNEVSKTPIQTISDFVSLVQSSRVQRVQYHSLSEYCSEVVSDEGSQFTVYTDRGIVRYDKPQAVVKCAKLKLSEKPRLVDSGARRVAASLYREVLILTNPGLSEHPNIVKLLWYDFIESPGTGEGLYTPTLILERSQYGSLSAFLDAHQEIRPEIKISLSAGVTSGLLALHQAGFVHGDVKTSNVLVFPLKAQAGNYVVKLTDFGSIVPLERVRHGSSVRYRGTAITNAPEVSEQSSLGQLDDEGLKKCDAYSLGLLLLWVAAGELQPDVLAKDKSVLQCALSHLARAGNRGCLGDYQSLFEMITELLLKYEPSERCSDLSAVENLLRSFDITSPWFGDDYEHTNLLGMKHERCHQSNLKMFDDPLYFEFNLDQEIEAERDTQSAVVRVLKKQSQSSIRNRAGKAFFQLAIAYGIGYGTRIDVSLALDLAVKSAQRGYLPALATTTAWFQAYHRELLPTKDTHVEWLQEATAWGSHTASKILKRLDAERYAEARANFHRRGGYNQYFYSSIPSLPVQPLRSKECNVSLPANIVNFNLEERRKLVEAVVMYGDAGLLSTLIRTFEINPNIPNGWGETLFLLCCKAGNLEILKLLHLVGAKYSPIDSTEKASIDPPMQWLVAFDEDDVGTATNLILQIGMNEVPSMDVFWNHPSIDLPGRFPLGTPLHTAAFCDSFICIDAFEKVLANSMINYTGPSEVTPIEYAVPRLKVHAARYLTSCGALHDKAYNSYVLAELGSQLRHEVRATAASSFMSEYDAVAECLDIVLKERPELRDKYLDSTGAIQSSPLISAVTYRNEDAVKALIERGCDVNVCTDIKYDGKAAVHFLPTSKLQDDENNIFELLENAGADFNVYSATGGMFPLHFAARDDNLVLAKKLIDRNADLNSATASYHQTPLHVAAYYGSYEVAGELLQRGANTEAEHKLGAVHEYAWDMLTPIAFAASKCRTDMIELLLNAGASPYARPHTEHTLIHFATVERTPMILERLLDIEQLQDPSVIDAKASKGITALHLCVGNLGRHEHLRLLINHGADVNITTPSGDSVLDIALTTRAQVFDCLQTENPLEHLDPALWTSVQKPHKPLDLEQEHFGSFEVVSPVEESSIGDLGEGNGEYDEYEMMIEEDVEKFKFWEEEEEPVFDLALELQKCDATIRLLQELGAQNGRMCIDPRPPRLFSLIQHSLNAILDEYDDDGK